MSTAPRPERARTASSILRDPNLLLENNFAEWNLRAQALGRSNWLFAGGHGSAENTAVAYTLVQTAKLHGLYVQAYLTWALERVASCERAEDYAALTPMAYEEAQRRAGDGYTVRHPGRRSVGGRTRGPWIGGGLLTRTGSAPRRRTRVGWRRA